MVGHLVVLCKCRTILKPYLDTKYHNLLKLSNPVTTELLGADLEQKIANGARVSEAGRCLAVQLRQWSQKKKTFTPRGGRQPWQQGQMPWWPSPRPSADQRGRGRGRSPGQTNQSFASSNRSGSGNFNRPRVQSGRGHFPKHGQSHRGNGGRY